MATTDTHRNRRDGSSFRNEKLSFERVTFLFPRIVMSLLVFAPFFVVVRSDSLQHLP
jgi:hypothetical protein